jgi:hypothetical protein
LFFAVGVVGLVSVESRERAKVRFSPFILSNWLKLLDIYRQCLSGAAGAAVIIVWYKYTFFLSAHWPATGG